MEENSNESKLMPNKILQYAAIFVAIFTPYAYLLGLVYYQGYMNAFGVGAESFPLSTADIYVNSYMAIGLMIFDVIKSPIELFQSRLFYAALPSLVLVIYIFIKVSDYFKKSSPKKNLKSALIKIINFLHFKNNDLTKALAFVSIPTYMIMLFFYVLASISLFWWGLPVWADHKGEATAKENIKKYLEKGCVIDTKTKWNNCIFVAGQNGATLHQGLLIAKKDAEIAIFKKDGSYLIKLNDDVIVRKKLN